MASDASGLYVGGKFTFVGSDNAAPRLARLNLTTGAVDHAFNPAPDGEVRAIALGGSARLRVWLRRLETESLFSSLRPAAPI